MNAPIIVAGAGIGGLTAALALAHNGRRALVLEQAPVITEVGAGLQIAPNAGRVLARLGLDEALAAVALEPQAVNIRRGRDGDRLARLDLTVARARWGAPFRVFHRADLQQILLQAARAHPQIAVRENARVARFTPHENGVEIETQGAGGSGPFLAAGLVGADGGHDGVLLDPAGDQSALEPVAPPRVGGDEQPRTCAVHAGGPLPRAAEPPQIAGGVLGQQVDDAAVRPPQHGDAVDLAGRCVGQRQVAVAVGARDVVRGVQRQGRRDHQAVDAARSDRRRLPRTAPGGDREQHQGRAQQEQRTVGQREAHAPIVAPRVSCRPPGGAGGSPRC